MALIKIKANEFVKRQTKESRFSYFDGTWEELEQVVTEHFAANPREGYKHGVILVPVPADRFFTSTVELTLDTPVKAEVTRRREGEGLFVSVTVDGPKLPAKHVDIVLYARHVLLENNEQSTEDAVYEIVSINARHTEEPEPMSPLTMARNFLELPGGTKGDYTAEQFAKSIVFWASRAAKE